MSFGQVSGLTTCALRERGSVTFPARAPRLRWSGGVRASGYTTEREPITVAGPCRNLTGFPKASVP